MDTSTAGSGGSSALFATPSTRQRFAAVVSLFAALVLVCTTVLMLLGNPSIVVGGLIGLALIAGGGWWAVTERNPRRALGITGMALGGVAVCAGIVVAAATTDGAILRVLLLVALVGIAAGTARAALVPDLHELDRRRGRGHVRPSHPVLI